MVTFIGSIVDERFRHAGLWQRIKTCSEWYLKVLVERVTFSTLARPLSSTILWQGVGGNCQYNSPNIQWFNCVTMTFGTFKVKESLCVYVTAQVVCFGWHCFNMRAPLSLWYGQRLCVFFHTLAGMVPESQLGCQHWSMNTYPCRKKHLHYRRDSNAKTITCSLNRWRGMWPCKPLGLQSYAAKSI